MKEHAKKPISSIILIADAPAKAKSVVVKDRKNYGGEKVWLPKFGEPTDYLE